MGYTQSGGVRPFGVSLLVAGWDDINGCQLWQVDPSGSYFAWKATAMGKGQANVKTFLEKRYTDDMEQDDAIARSIQALRENFEGQMKEENVEVAIVTADQRKFRTLTLTQLREYFSSMA